MRRPVDPAVLLRRFAARSGDALLERTVGSRLGLRVVFAAMEREFVPERADGWTGDIRYELRPADGPVRCWTVSVEPGRARARRGAGDGPAALVIKLGVADFVRIAAGQVDAATALLGGRLDLEGDISVAMRLGPMFGQRGPF